MHIEGAAVEHHRSELCVDVLPPQPLPQALDNDTAKTPTVQSIAAAIETTAFKVGERCCCQKTEAGP